jgi:transcriptional regulator with XRE-family HTH domain
LDRKQGAGKAVPEQKGLGQRIREVRNARGWTLDQLAKEAGLTKGFLSQVENGKAPRPSGRVLLLLARALGASVDWLLTGNADGEVAEAERAIQIPPELQRLAIEKGWSAQKMIRIVGAHNDLLARRSDKARNVTLTTKDWLEFVSRIEPYIDDD